MIIFVVDDDRDLLDFLEASLSASFGSVVRSFDDGARALEALATAGADVLVCDLDLPGVAGEEVARRAHELPQRPFIILMSGDLRRLERAREQADELLPKPFGINDLTVTIAAWRNLLPERS